MIGRLAGLALDARFAIPAAMPGITEPVARARAARWIAANALAARGVPFAVDGEPPDAPGVFALRADSLTALLTALAALPLLVDAASLPGGWRLALRALGLPALDRPATDAVADGASVLIADGTAGRELVVDREWRGFRVRIGPPQRTLVA
jgi:hypothetical protein